MSLRSPARRAALLLAAIVVSVALTTCATGDQGAKPERRGPGTTGVTVNRDAARDAEPTVLVDGRVRALPDSAGDDAIDVDEATLRSITRQRLEAAGFELIQPAELLVRICVGRYEDWRGRPYARVEVHAYRIVPNSFRPELVWQLWLQERVGHAAGRTEAGNPAAADYGRLLGELLDPARLRELRTGS